MQLYKGDNENSEKKVDRQKRCDQTVFFLSVCLAPYFITVRDFKWFSFVAGYICDSVLVCILLI